MRVTRVRVRSFGPITHLDSGEESTLPGFVAVLGPNESGKSAFHRLLATLLFGFYPANRDLNPFVAWKGGDIDLRAELELDSGETWQVHRRLLSSPRGELIRGQHVESLDNRTLPNVTQVDEKIFRQVYAVSAEDLLAVASGAWDAVRDQLIVSMGSDDLHPPRVVIEALQHEASQLWRSTNRGNHRHKLLRADLQSLQEERGAAEARDRVFREELGRLTVIEDELEVLRHRRTEAATRVERLRELLPLRTQLRRYDALAVEVGDPSELEGLPRDPEARWAELQTQEREQRVRRQEFEEIERKIRERVESLSAVEFEGVDQVRQWIQPLTAISMAEFKSLVLDYQMERRRLEDLEDQVTAVEGTAVGSSGSAPRWTLAPAAIGLALLVAGGLGGPAPIWMAGVAILLATLGLAAPAWIRWARLEGSREARMVEVGSMHRRLDEGASRVARRRDEIRTRLEPLRLRNSETLDPSLALVEALEALRQLVEGWQAHPGKAPDDLEDVKDLEARLARAGGDTSPEGLRRVADRIRRWELLTRVGEELRQEAGDLDALRTRIDEVERDGEAWTEVPERLAREETRLAEIDAEIQERREERSGLRERVRTLGEGTTADVLEGQIEVVREAMREAERLHDWKLVQARLLERAEAGFREAHQPDLLRRAEGHLEAITGGRYDRILLGDDESPGDVRLQADHLPHPVPVAFPISTGTREQVYFALRLAIVDHLDEGRETLPLLLDEVFVHWDPIRRGQALDVLRDVSASRQVFLFTCHPHMAEEVTQRGGRVLELGPHGENPSMDLAEGREPG